MVLLKPVIVLTETPALPSVSALVAEVGSVVAEISCCAVPLVPATARVALPSVSVQVEELVPPLKMVCELVTLSP